LGREREAVNNPAAPERARQGATELLRARRSWVALDGRRLLVQEVFLPELGRC
jgi:chorismate-pyruvate lyase